MVPSADRLQKLGASSVSLVPSGSVRLSSMLMVWPGATASGGISSTGADLGNLGVFLGGGAAEEAEELMASATSSVTTGSWKTDSNNKHKTQDQNNG